jgi:hypothetical protein
VRVRVRVRVGVSERVGVGLSVRVGPCACTGSVDRLRRGARHIGHLSCPALVSI